MKKIFIFIGAALVTTLAFLIFSPILGINAFFQIKISSEETRTLASISKLDELTPGICSATEVGATKILIDSRTNSTYNVVKMPDNRCWMVENMRYTNESLEKNNLVSDSKDNVIGKYYNGTSLDTICPGSWSLPTRDEFMNLAFVSLNFENFNLATSGYFDAETMSFEDGASFFWAKDAPDGKTRTLIKIDSEKVVTSKNVATSSVAPVRCIVNQTTEAPSEQPTEAETTEPIEPTKTEAETTERAVQSESGSPELLDNTQTPTEPSSSQETSSQTSEPTSQTQTQ